MASWAVAIIDAKRHPGLDPGSQTLEIVQLLFATLNPGKQLEIKKLLADTGVHLVFPQDANLLDLKVDETGQTFAQNSALKATAFGLKSGLLTAADDSGLGISSLDNFPGVKSDRWLKGTWEEKFVSAGSPHDENVFWLTGTFINYEPESKDTDEYWINSGYASIVPVKFDFNDYNFIKELISWNIEEDSLENIGNQ